MISLDPRPRAGVEHLSIVWHKGSMHSSHENTGIPAIPDRGAEIIWLALLVVSLLASVSAGLYVWINLQLPEALWSILPFGIFPCACTLAIIRARNDRRRAIAEYERYRRGIEKAAAELDLEAFP